MSVLIRAWTIALTCIGFATIDRADIRFEDPDDRHRIVGRLDDDPVRFLQSRAGHVDPTEMAQSAILPENDFGEGAVNVHSYDTTHDLSPIRMGSSGRRDTF
ncbi:hypothetical protein K2X14_16695 [Acetobacter sp. TBRC 12305]|uniref:hypothetical protein n=1 Tax=Acetobacter garciniae TaxID=2817435 RepID=UPI001C7390F1|nr:hypothetical protein [Acetobacter garciniae]MBX0346465.1 hypothetical protein [Acetobacter garciniae]